MNPADKRLRELLDKWLTSLQLHLNYSALEDAVYRQIQPWPEHERPSRWILETALQKVRQLQAEHGARLKVGDESFAEALEWMSFLTNLVGSQHIRRFIPLAEPQSEAPAPGASGSPAPAASQLAKPSDDSTREMPKPKIAGTKPSARREGKSAGPSAGRTALRTAKDQQQMILKDAKRLLDWGRKWYELPELISSMAGRPGICEVRRILREHKSSFQ